jgi:CheY-like chemotaxis protein
MSKSIVIIDDSRPELRLYEEAFKDSNLPYQLKIFEDGISALKFIIIHVQEIFAILCDISMPGMSGSDLLEKINESHELKMECVPFIFLSNSKVKDDVEKAYSLAAQGYFQKPMTLAEMQELFNVIVQYWTKAQIPREF